MIIIDIAGVTTGAVLLVWLLVELTLGIRQEIKEARES